MKFISDGTYSGSQASTVYSRNRYGAYTRNRKAPVNPRTVFQTQVRTFFNNISVRWQTLSDAQRLVWNSTAAALPPWKDALGQNYQPSGFNLYMSSNLMLYNSFLPLVDDCVTPYVQPTMPIITVGPIVGPPAHVLGLSFAPTPIDTDMQMVVYATAVQTAGTHFVKKSLYRFIASLAAASASPQNMDADYAGVFGAVPPTGGKVFFRACIFSKLSGYYSAFCEASYIIP